MTDKSQVVVVRLPLSEQGFQRAVIDLAHLRGWMVAAFRPCEARKGWRTPMQGDVGYPDLTMARRGRVVFAELKSEKGRLSPGQEAWRSAIRGVWTIREHHVWRPSDWDAILEVLR